MKVSIQETALAAVAATLTFFSAAVVADGTGLKSMEYQGCYSSSYPMYTNSSLKYQYQSTGWCQEQCGQYAQKAVFGLTQGDECWCGDELPANSTKVSNDKCDTGCDGYGLQMCGGDSVWTVYTSGLTDDVDSVSDSAASSAAASTETGTTTTATTKNTAAATHGVSTVTQGGTTIYLTPTAAATSSTATGSSKSSSGGSNKAGIAAGIVVGIVALAAVAGGTFFYIRHKKRKAIEQEFQRQQSMNQFTSGTIKSERSATDSRLDPAIMYRRQSDGSIADETDFSRRVLKVTNPDRQG